LVEIKHQSGEPNHSVGDTTASFGFIAWGIFAQTATMEDVGKTFPAPLEAIPDFQFGLTRQTHFDMVLNFNRSEAFIGSEALEDMHFETNLGAIIMDRYAPVLGPALVGYTITDITRTIDRFELLHVSGPNYAQFGTQTIRIYGDAIPEPGTGTLMGITALFAAACLSTRRGVLSSNHR
jgi:hypothetical protein